MSTYAKRLARWLVGGALAIAGLAVAATSLSAAPTAPVPTAQHAEEYQTAQNDYRVCCKRGSRDWWSGRRDCRRNGGYVAANWQCRNDNANNSNNLGNQRICCKRGRHDWWSTRRECGRRGGYHAANWQCRNDGNNYAPRRMYRY